MGTENVTEITFSVIGVPAPQGSKSAFVRGGKAVIVDGSSQTGRQKHATWRAAVAYAARGALLERGGERFAGPVHVWMAFTLPAPASTPYRVRHATKPDLDKLVRSVLDALTESGLISDDARVFSLEATKLYARPGDATGVEITVFDHSSQEAADQSSRKLELRSQKVTKVSPS